MQMQSEEGGREGGRGTGLGLGLGGEVASMPVFFFFFISLHSECGKEGFYSADIRGVGRHGRRGAGRPASTGRSAATAILRRKCSCTQWTRTPVSLIQYNKGSIKRCQLKVTEIAVHYGQALLKWRQVPLSLAEDPNLTFTAVWFSAVSKKQFRQQLPGKNTEL